MPKFIEIIRSGTSYEFVGRQRFFLGLSAVLIVISILMLPINYFWRGAALNYSVDFRGGTEIRVEFANPMDVGAIRGALDKGGFHNPEVVRFTDTQHPHSFLLRLHTISAISEVKAKEADAAVKTKFGAKSRFDFREGGDKAYVTLENVPDLGKEKDAVEALKGQVEQALKGVGVNALQIQKFGPDNRSYEVTLLSLDKEMKAALEKQLGAGVVKSIPSVESVGSKAGKELRDDAIKALVYAMLLIMLYIAIRFDFRYGPGTIASLIHDAIILVGAFAVTYKEFSLTTVAAVLTVIGYSMNDTVVVFDRVRENVARLRDRKFDRIVNQSMNEILSRTLLTSLTTFFTTLAMNVFGTGVIRDFAFAMNVGIVTGTYSSVFIAAPILIWLNDKYVALQRRQQARGGKAPAPRAKPASGPEEDEEEA
ncbi:MAG: protein translocase subunit SecF [Deltaproteobacteria bacterium]|nr:protein translocase subunit SecF [Deltaproteobacteria bacterium]